MRVKRDAVSHLAVVEIGRRHGQRVSSTEISRCGLDAFGQDREFALLVLMAAHAGDNSVWSERHGLTYGNEATVLVAERGGLPIVAHRELFWIVSAAR